MKITKELMEKEAKFGAHNYQPLPVVLTRGEGVWVWDVEGNKYLDLLSGYSALSFGHLHPRLVKRAKEQLDRLTLTSRAFYTDQLGPWCEELSQLTGLDRALPMNTGAEAVETAIKIARKWAYTVKGVPKHKAEIIVCENNFHGRTTTVISFSTTPEYRDPFGPFTPGFVTIPFGDAEALEKAITPNTAAFLVEPIQGEGGVNIPPEGYLKKVREICDRHNILLIADEVQVGLARTGEMFAFQHEGIEPDLLILGKALGGGIIPISAVVGKNDVMEVLQPGEHGSTFGGNPLACAISREAIALLREEKLHLRSRELGEFFKQKLTEALASSEYIREIRGRGLFVGIEFTDKFGDAKKAAQALLEEGVLSKETHKKVLRFAPPLIIEREELLWAVEKVKKVVLGK